MINIKTIYITTGISMLFGVYSIYNILEYLRILNNYRIKKINSLQHLVDATNKKYNELYQKHLKLQQEYINILDNYERVNQEIKILSMKIIYLEDELSPKILLPVSPNTSPVSIIDDEHKSIHNELSGLNDNIQLHIDTTLILDNSDSDVDVEFIESLSLEYSCDKTNNDTSIKEPMLCNLDKELEQSHDNTRIRSISITEINWLTLTKKLFFG